MDPITLIAIGAGVLALGASCPPARREEKYGSSGGSPLDSLTSSVATMVKRAKPQVMEKLDRVDSDINKAVRSTVKEVPVRAFDLLSTATLEGIDDLARIVPSEARQLLGIRTAVKKLQVNANQAKNLEEVSEALGALKTLIRKSRALNGFMEGVAKRMEVEDVLGTQAAHNAGRILGALVVGGVVTKKFMAGEKLGVSTPFGDIALSKNLAYKANLRIPVPVIARAAVSVELEGKGLKKAPTSGSAEVTMPFVRKGTATLGVEEVSRSGVKGFSSSLGMQTIPERGQFQVGVRGTPHQPVQAVTMAAPTVLSRGRLHDPRRGIDRTTTLAPTASVDPRRGGERKVGVQLKVPI
jgi:hypothetical protein